MKKNDRTKRTRRLSRVTGWASVLGAVGVIVLVAAGCTADKRVDDEGAARRVAVAAALTKDEPPPTATLQNAAKDPVDWTAILGKLSQDNVFRLIHLAHTKAKNRGDDGMSALTPAEQKIVGAFNADMKEVYALHALAGPNGLGDKERLRVAELQGKYAKARQEVLDALLASPTLSADGRTAVLTAIGHANGARSMGIKVPSP